MELDKNIKNKLNAREIQPSASSWDRLDAMLALEEKKNKRSFSWLYIAASFLLFMGLSFWLFPENKEISPIENNVVVEENNNSINTNLLVIDSLNTEGTLVESKIKTNSQEKQIESKVMEKKNLRQENNVVAVNSNYDVMETKNKIIQNEVEENQVLRKPKFKIKINANSLLSAAENEIDKEYKETNLDKLTRNFIEVKSAIANRNYE